MNFPFLLPFYKCYNPAEKENQQLKDLPPADFRRVLERFLLK